MAPSLRALSGIVLASVLVVAAVPADAAIDAREHASQPAKLGERMIVGFHSGVSELAIVAAGGTMRSSSTALGIAVVSALDAKAFVASMKLNSLVAFVEKNGPVFADDMTSDASSWDASSWDASSWDAASWDASSWDASSWDASSWDASSWDASSWDASSWDASSWDSSGWDASSWDASSWDANGWDASSWDSSGWDASSWDASSWDASSWDASSWDASSWDSATLTAQGQSADWTAGKDPLFPKQWGVRAVRSAAATNLASASAKTICVVDSGVDHTHPDLSTRMWRDASGRVGHDFVNGDNDPMDDAGHGTHVAGIAAAAIKNGAGIRGASDAKIMAVKVLDANGVGTEANLALSIEWCIARGAKVISMSLGTPEHSPAVHRAVKLAELKGVAMVASIGNAGKCYDCVRFPAAYDEVVSVGALRPDGRPAAFTSVSWAVDVAAPGIAIVSTYKANAYRALNGTSMATPFVSAAAAQLYGANETMKPATMRAIFNSTSTDLGPAGRDPYTGAGALNAEKAVLRALGRN